MDRQKGYFHVQANGLIFKTEDPIKLTTEYVDWTKTLDNTTIVLRNFPSYDLAKEAFDISRFDQQS